MSRPKSFEIFDRGSPSGKQVTAADAALAEVDDQLRELERRRSDLRSRIASLDTTVRHQAAREVELQSDLQRLVRQQNLMKNRVAEAQAERRIWNPFSRWNERRLNVVAQRCCPR